MKIAIGCDEAGYELKEILKQHLNDLGYQAEDFGVDSAEEKILYPDMAIKVAQSIASGKHDRAVLICGTGIGVAISANKVKGVRAAQVADTYSAERAQKSNDAQIICIGARVTGYELAKSIVTSFMNSTFSGGGSADKIARITEFEASN